MNINIKQESIKEVIINRIEAKSLLRKGKKIDSWFMGRYGMNLYRGCSHDCVYCDGRAEKYNVEGEFGTVVSVKANAVELLKRELNPARKRKPMKPGYMMIGGGVGDSYQEIEKELGLTRDVLELVKSYDYPVHILTKSSLVERDMELLKQIHKQKQAIISFSFSTVDDSIARIFEPCTSTPKERLNSIAKFKKNEMFSGVYYMPVIPFISDSFEQMESAMRAFKDAGADFVIFGGMTLKTGRQKDYFMKILQDKFPEKSKNYEAIYYDNQWGSAKGSYYKKINEQFIQLAKKFKVPIRIPASIYKDMIDENDRVVAILEQMDYILKAQNRKSPYSYGAYAVAQLKEPISTIPDLTVLKGVGPVTERIIKEIIKTGTSNYYEKLISFEA